MVGGGGLKLEIIHLRSEFAQNGRGGGGGGGLINEGSVISSEYSISCEY